VTNPALPSVKPELLRELELLEDELDEELVDELVLLEPDEELVDELVLLEPDDDALAALDVDVVVDELAAVELDDDVTLVNVLVLWMLVLVADEVEPAALFALMDELGLLDEPRFPEPVVALASDFVPLDEGAPPADVVPMPVDVVVDRPIIPPAPDVPPLPPPPSGWPLSRPINCWQLPVAATSRTPNPTLPKARLRHPGIRSPEDSQSPPIIGPSAAVSLPR
jgi:hypothetical protein